MIEIVLWIIGTSLLVIGGAAFAKKFGLPFLVAAFAGCIVIANVLASKVVVFGDFAVPAAVIIFTTAYSLTDLINEFFGKKEAHRAVWAGFFVNIVLVFAVYIAIVWEPAVFWPNQAAFEAIFSMTPRIVLGSMLAYLVSGHVDVIAFQFWKKFTGGKHLWLRNFGSNAVSLAVDTMIFIPIAFYGTFPIVPMLIGQYVAKMVISALNTPFVYLSRNTYNWMKK